MGRTQHTARLLPGARLASLLVTLVMAPTALAQSAPPVFERMAGTWSVVQRTWIAKDVEGPPLPAAVARREVVMGTFLEETMTQEGDGAGAFMRKSTINYDPVARRFAYFSMDSRAPQQMTYRSPPSPADRSGTLRFQGGNFVAAEWGPKKNVAFRYRLDVGDVVDGTQTVRLFLTPTAGGAEFKAFEYVYRDRR